MGLFDKLFGGSDDSAQEAQIEANQAALELQANLAEQARRDVIGLFGPSQAAQLQGFEQAFNLLGRAAPAQIDILQQGNLAAQRQQLLGLGAERAALLGLPQEQDFSTQNLLNQIQQLTLNVPDQPAVNFGISPFQPDLGEIQASPSGVRFAAPGSLGGSLPLSPPTAGQESLSDITARLRSGLTEGNVAQRSAELLNIARERGLTPNELARATGLTLADIQRGIDITGIQI